ncbi:MAG: Homocysteine S-methyltransferase [Anaerolineae bacterium]|nr:Homocysteine S-methyltransferase [Anaerolineae bacterium]
MNPLATILQTWPLVILDGALATELERRGADLNDPLWSAKLVLEQPELIAQVHRAYFRTGADCATTASYQATFEGFEKRGLSHAQARAALQKSIALARQARDDFWRDEKNRVGRAKPFIAASIGPFGAFLHDGSEYRGAYGLSENQLMDFHRERMGALIDAGADMLACETLPNLVEARALVKLLEEFPGTTAWFSFTARDERHISHGEPFADVVAEIAPHPQVAAIGVNCSSPRWMPALIRIARAATAKPIVVYPNSGETYDVTTNSWHGVIACADFGPQTRAWYELGARVIGGCCRTTPEHIQELAAWARSLDKNPVTT